jgi:hypothetical protein
MDAEGILRRIDTAAAAHMGEKREEFLTSKERTGMLRLEMLTLLEQALRLRNPEQNRLYHLLQSALHPGSAAPANPMLSP